MTLSFIEKKSEKFEEKEDKDQCISMPKLFKIRYPLSETYSITNEEKDIIAARNWITNKKAILDKVAEKQGKKNNEIISVPILGDHTSEYNGDLIYIKKNLKLKKFSIKNLLYNKKIKY